MVRAFDVCVLHASPMSNIRRAQQRCMKSSTHNSMLALSCDIIKESYYIGLGFQQMQTTKIVRSQNWIIAARDRPWIILLSIKTRDSHIILNTIVMNNHFCVDLCSINFSITRIYFNFNKFGSFDLWFMLYNLCKFASPLIKSMYFHTSFLQRIVSHGSVPMPSCQRHHQLFQ